MAVIAFFSSLFGAGYNAPAFRNGYAIPEETVPYRQIETTPKRVTSIRTEIPTLPTMP